MANNWQIDMLAGLDQNQSRAKINGQINKLKGQLKDISLCIARFFQSYLRLCASVAMPWHRRQPTW